MRIGIISDSHGNDTALREALQILEERKVRTIIHCGDIGTLRSLEVLGAATATIYYVTGNVDHSLPDIEMRARENNIHFAWEVVLAEIGEQFILAATHGDDQQTLGGLIMSQRFPYVCHGHSHHQRDERIGATRVINPGALQRARKHTIAILDTDRDDLEFIEVPEKPSKAAVESPHGSAASKTG